MGLLRTVHQLHRQLRRLWSPSAPRIGSSLPRRCRLEPFESRQLLSFTPTPVQVGAVYYEDAGTEDSIGDRIEITWSGGEPGTQLTKVTIDTDKMGDGLSIGDAFFDTAPGGLGDYASVPLSIVSSNGFEVLSATVVDGGTKLELTFRGFDPGEKLVLSVDVDEMGFADENDPNPTNAVCEGKEFQGSKLSATFAAPHFYEASGTARFYDSYTVTSGLNLPSDNYMPPGNEPHSERTAGAFFQVAQNPLPITIVGTVYEDADLDNIRDSGEQGIAGTTLTLLELVDGQYVATGKTAVTDANGQYKFEGVAPGTYRIVETQPGGYFSIGATAGKVGGSTRGEVTSVDVISSISLLGGEDSVSNDFAEAKPATLSGYVYHDADNDGVRDSGETGIGGATVRIQYLPPSGTAPTPIEVTTDANGYWSVEGLMPGNYRVEEVQPNGYLDGKDTAGTAGGVAHNPGDLIDGIRLTSGLAGREYNFGELVPSTISGRVVADADADGEYDPGEQLLSGVTVYLLDASGNRIATTVTDANGEYRFTGLAPGMYGVQEVQPQGYYDGVERVGSVGGSLLPPDSIIDIELVSGTDAVRYDFYELLPSSISGRVVADANANGAYDPGEQLLGGVTVYLLDSSGSRIATAVTDANGEYRFTGLAPGLYGVEEVQPQGYYDGLDRVGSVGGTLVPPDTIKEIRLVSGTEAVRYDFYELLPSRISGRVVADANANGVFDTGERTISGVTVHLLDAAGNRIASTTTDANGEYAFENLAPGTYGVEEEQPQGYYDGADKVGSAGGTLVPPDSIRQITLVSGTDAVRYDFFEVLPSSISGRVIADSNNNGVFDQGDRLLSGVTVYLLDASGNRIASSLTNANGEYSFTGLAPGSYGVEEIQPQGYYDGADKVGTVGGTLVPPDSIRQITLVSGTEGVNYDFYELLPVSLSGYVYADDNNNGMRNAGEAGIAGVVLKLLGADGQPTGLTVTTDANGFYKFDGLEPGKVYGVAEVQPTGYYDGLDTAGTAGGTAHNPGDFITGAKLGPGVHGKNYNFGELRPASIGGRVLLDANNNGRVDAGEQPIAGVTVWLLDAAGNRITSTTTDANGRYLFSNLQPGTYGIEEVQPSGYFDGEDFVGTVGGTKVANDRITGAVLVPGADATDYDFLELQPATISGYVFQDGSAIPLKPGDPIPDPATVRDGQFTADDKPLAGVVLRLGDASGAPILDANGRPITTVTDARGFYQFTGLEPGLYTVLQEQPNGYYDSIDTAGSNGGIAINPHDNIDPMILGQLAVNPRNDAIIRIPVNGGETAVMYNFSEVRMESVPDDPPPPTPPPPTTTPWTPLEPPKAVPFDSSPVLRSYYLPAPVQRTLSLAGGGGSIPTAYTWHLSVINGGQPRRENEGSKQVADSSSVYFNPVSWNGSDMSRAEWLLMDQDKPVKKAVFGIEGGRPVVGDFDGNGTIDIGVFFDGLWFLDLNGNGVWDDGDLWVRLGKEGDQPVTGDWDGDGKTDLGIFGPSWAGDSRAVANEPGLPDADNVDDSGRFKNVPPPPDQATLGWRTMKRTAKGQLRADLIDHVFQYGTEGDVAISGDWNGDGIANIGLFRGGIWYLDADGNGRWTPGDAYIERFGAPGDIPIVGDFNGDGIDDLGVYRKGTWYVDANGDHKLDAHDKVFHLGGPHDRPFVGDFNGDGIDEIGVYQDGRFPQNKQAAEPGPSEGGVEEVANQPAETTVK